MHLGAGLGRWCHSVAQDLDDKSFWTAAIHRRFAFLPFLQRSAAQKKEKKAKRR
jgi:hypothetical protein